jgi:predicted esterase
MAVADSDALQRFVALSDQVLDLYQHREYARALACIDAAAPALPEHRSMLVYWAACLHAVAGDSSAALAVLRDAAAAGGWWSERLLRDDADLAVLQQQPEFENLIALSRQREAAARSAGGPRLLLFAPPGPPRAALIALHGASWRAAEEFATFWQPLTEAEVLVAVPQSSQPTSDSGFGWPDPALAARELAEHHKTVRAVLGQHRAPLLLAGFSQGGTLTLRWALSGQPFPVDGFIAVNPGLHGADSLLEFDKQGPARTPPGVLLVGDRDPRRAMIEDLATQLRHHEYTVRLETMPDTAHWFSTDFTSRAKQAVDYLLEHR